MRRPTHIITAAALSALISTLSIVLGMDRLFAFWMTGKFAMEYRATFHSLLLGFVVFVLCRHSEVFVVGALRLRLIAWGAIGGLFLQFVAYFVVVAVFMPEGGRVEAIGRAASAWAEKGLTPPQRWTGWWARRRGAS